MFKASTVRRFIALLLLVALPAGVGARLSLDANTTFDRSPSVEAEHDRWSFKAHDHRLCVLFASAPPWLAPTCPVPAVSSPVFTEALDADGDDRGRERHRSGLARAPPYLA